MAVTQIKNGFHGGSDDQLLVNPDGSINVNTTGGSGGNASVGPTGATAPAQATQIGGVDPSGNLTPVAVTSSGSVKTTEAGFSSISPGFPTQITVGTSSIELFPANTVRKYAHIFNNSPQPIYIQYQVSAALNQGIRINSGSFFTLDSENLWLGIINAIGLQAGQMIDVLEGI